MIAVLKLGRVHGSKKLRQAIESATEMGCFLFIWLPCNIC